MLQETMLSQTHESRAEHRSSEIHDGEALYRGISFKLINSQAGSV